MVCKKREHVLLDFILHRKVSSAMVRFCLYYTSVLVRTSLNVLSGSAGVGT